MNFETSYNFPKDENGNTLPAVERMKAMLAEPREPEPVETPTLISVKSANEWTAEAADRIDPDPLWDCFWYEGEVCCLFADSNLGKSILAVQIASEIARREKVLYFDFELSDKQFQLRYTDSQGIRHLFPANLMRAEIEPRAMVEGDFEEAIMHEIERVTLQSGAKVIVIDNLTWMCNTSDKGDAAGILMMNLMQLKRLYDWSILVIAHTPKRSLTSPITQNDLAGSKKLFNFFDSVFAIGKSATDEGLRYIKQLKIRNGEMRYGADNVKTCEIVKEGSMLEFKMRGTVSERAHLKEIKVDEEEARMEQILKWDRQKLGTRWIAEQLDLSASTVQRMLRKWKQSHPADADSAPASNCVTASPRQG